MSKASTHFFNRLNYTLANEDTSLELALLPSGVEHLFAVAGSGGRILPLLAKRPKYVTCVDLAQEQLFLAELRFESAREFEHPDFLDFWGYPRMGTSLISGESRKALFNRLNLAPETLRFFETLFSQLNWGSLLYLGRWERTFAKLSQGVRKITGPKGAELFRCQTLEEQIDFLEHGFPALRWKLTLFLLGNASVFNALLYKGSFPEKNIPESMVEFYTRAFDRLFRTDLARKNFFLQLVFFGKILYPEGCPIECDPEVYRSVKAGLQDVEIHYVKGDMIEQIQKSTRKIDFLSFSDVPSYFSGETEWGFLQRVRPYLADRAKVVVRNYLHLPQGLITDGYRSVEENYRSEIAREKVQVYHVNVFQNEVTA